MRRYKTDQGEGAASGVADVARKGKQTNSTSRPSASPPLSGTWKNPDRPCLLFVRNNTKVRGINIQKRRIPAINIVEPGHYYNDVSAQV